MKRTFLFLCLFAFVLSEVKGQYCTNPNMVWAFGNHAGLNFITGSPVPFYSPISILEGSAAVSDVGGNALFYTDGKVVWDRTSTVMPHGSSVVPYSTADAAQGAQIVPIAGTSLYYIFSGDVYTSGHRAYTLVDMSLNGGMGDVVTAVEDVSMGTNFSENMTEVAGNNCDIWLILHRRDSSVFWTYNITAAGISPPVISPVGTLTHYDAGVIKVTPNRQKIVVQNCESASAAYGTELYDFDPATGIVSNCQLLSTQNGYGAEFSADNTKLYTSGLFGTIVYQYDISLPTTADIIASKTAVGTGASIGDMKLAVDSKIYIVKNGVGSLDCINSPNLGGSACNYVSNSISLSAGTSGELGLPNIIYYVAPNDTFHTHHDTLVCVPIGGSITLTAHDTSMGFGTCRVPTYLWNDGITTTPTKVVPTIGTYWVYIYNGCGMTIDTIHLGSLYPDTISGANNICAGAPTSLTATIPGGTWTTGGSVVATVGSSSGIVTGLTSGVVAISYSSPVACPATFSITINPTPTAISGPLSMCAGLSASLTNGIAGGTWSSSNTTVATVNASTGYVTGSSPGTATITYSLSSGCTPATVVVTVNPLPSIITGATHVCLSATTTLFDSVSGGAWSTSFSGVATVALLSGIVSPVSVGTASIYYTLPTGCLRSTFITVNPVPSYITGLSTVCVGLTTTFFDGLSGGTWSSGNLSIATIGSVSGVISGVAPGTAVMTYTTAEGCSAGASLSVFALPTAITGPTTVCTGAAITLSDATPGGTWTSGAPGIASVDFVYGSVVGISAGVAPISYITGTGCYVVSLVTVNNTPSGVVGPAGLCAGNIAYLGDLTSGGTWSSSVPGVATVDLSGGVLTALSAGSVTITYTMANGCYSVLPLSVNALPSPISGGTMICVGLTTSLSASPAGGTWVSGTPATATVSPAGAVAGLAMGTTLISYSLPSGCMTTTTVTVNTSPGPISGVPHVCVGAATALSDMGGGTWTSGIPAIATIGLGTGVVGGIIPGVTVITYSLGVGCSISINVTVNPLPSSISGTGVVCAGSTTALADGGGGTWYSTSPGIATVGSASGVVSGVTAGLSLITYALPAGCYTTKTITVNQLPGLITGDLGICSGAGTILYDLTSGGTWSSTVTTIATINSTTGAVTGGGAGTAVITYRLGTGCARTATITVNPLPGPVSGNVPLCQGVSVTLTDPAGSGVWTSGIPSIASVGSTSGILTGVTAGTTAITFTTLTGCQRMAVVTVNPLPFTIGGPSALCVGAMIIETEGMAGGSWSGGTASVATVSGAGVVTGIALGSTSITYTLPTGCAVAKSVSVSLSPGPIIGSSTVCAGAGTDLSDIVPGGAWSSGTPGVAAVGSLDGTVTGIIAGSATITYSLGTGCTVTKIITVTPAPAAIAGNTGVCVGMTTALSDATAGGTWSSGAATIATISPGGIALGISIGTAVISYTTGSGCPAMATITVNPIPTSISGPSTICSGNAITLTDGVTGGVWSCASPGPVSVDPVTGMVSGLSAGTVSVTYSLGAGCVATKPVTVYPLSPITGTTGVCVGISTALADVVSGGEWVSSTPATATINALSGVVTGLLPGTSLITYTTPAGCVATTTATVNLAPTVISGNFHVCPFATTTLTNGTPGGAWSSGSPAIASIDMISGIVTGLAPGTSIITYSLGSGCVVHTTVTVNTAPLPVTGLAKVCVGSSISLSDPTPGGSWGSSDPVIATVTAMGVVTGLSDGSANIMYTGATGCFATKSLTVNLLPLAITGSTSICEGQTITLNEISTGGTWSSTNLFIATINSLGTVGGLLPGPANILYTLPTGCFASFPILVNAAPSAISGGLTMCVGATTALGDPTTGGTWSTASPMIATVGLTGIVTGISIGVSVISYIHGGCPATTTVTVNPLPSAVSGPGKVCAGSIITLSDIPSGGTWSSISPGVANVGAVSGVLTGMSPGTATIVYSLGVGCNANTVITVNSLPPVPGFPGGSAYVCAGYATTITDSISGGLWTSSDWAIATINPAGIATGLSGGMVTISYTIGTGCSSGAPLHVIQVPSISGPDHLCAFGDTMALYDAMAGGDWTSTSATVSYSGVVTGLAAGLATVTYTLGAGCYTVKALTVDPLPGAIMVTGTGNLCIGAMTTLSDTSTGGAWGCTPAPVATVSTGGVLTGLSAGVATVSYISSITGCVQTRTVTVNPHPSAIGGSANICAGSTATLTDSVSGGVWTSSSSAVASVVAGTGSVTGVSPGAATVTYYLGGGCAAYKAITVNAIPAVYAITGGGNYCAGTGGVAIGVGGSETAIVYRLYNGSTLEETIPGTGSAIDFGLQTLVGTYTVIAGNSVTGCATHFPDSVAITVTPSVIPSVIVSASPGTTVCSGIPVTLTAMTSHGGAAPVYWWAVNGTSTGAAGSTYFYTPADNDVVTAVLTSNAVCALPDTASNSITMSIITPTGPIVTISAIPGTNIQPGERVTLTAVVMNGGTLPVFQWSLNGTAIAGATDAGYAGVFNDNDTITCEVTANTLCNPEGGDRVIIKVGVGVPAYYQAMQGLVIIPNPNTGEFTIKGSLGFAGDQTVLLEITDMLGRSIYKEDAFAKNGQLNASIRLFVANGVYLLTARSLSGNNVFHIVVER